MQNLLPVRVLVENRGDELIVASIFADLVRESAVKVVMCWDASSAISLAESWLLSEPSSLPLALILNCASEPDEFRRPVERILLRDAPSDRWCVALAIPDLTSWAERDSRFTAALAVEKKNRGILSKYDIFIFFKEWAAEHAFNRDELFAQEPEFRTLYEYVLRHTHSAATAGRGH
jgi:hypothetical protein